MSSGDILEWLAAGGLTYGVYVLAGRGGAAIAGAVCLGYFAQCYNGPLPWRRKGSQ